jgi:hypothetical protein
MGRVMAASARQKTRILGIPIALVLICTSLYRLAPYSQITP